MTITARPIRSLGAALLLIAAASLAPGFAVRAAEPAVKIPPPTLDENVKAAEETAVFAGGCFWGVQGVFQHVNGVKSAVSGYAGGAEKDASYEKVGTGRTGHAEAVKITFDPNKVSYGRLLQIFFSVAHNPTQLNFQGPDHGPQYRSEIFAADGGQRRIAEAYVAQLQKTGAFDGPIVTKISEGAGFYPAEPYHQDFLTLNPTYPYIVYNDLPKIDNLRMMFPDQFVAVPVLVNNAKG